MTVDTIVIIGTIEKKREKKEKHVLQGYNRTRRGEATLDAGGGRGACGSCTFAVWTRR